MKAAGSLVMVLSRSSSQRGTAVLRYAQDGAGRDNLSITI